MRVKEITRVVDGCEKMILDCGELSYISSMGLGMLMRVHSKMKKKGGEGEEM